MDEKTTAQLLPTASSIPNAHRQQHQQRRRHPLRRAGFGLIGLCAVVLLLNSVSRAVRGVDYLTPSLAPLLFSPSPSPSSPLPPAGTHSRVPLEAHIMSKCPDARDCLQQMILPVMQRAADKVDFRLSYIGVTHNDSSAVTCMHGQQECLGNMIELCAAALYPEPKAYLGFTMCLSRNYRDIAQDDLVSECALEHGLDEKQLGDCLLKDDGAYSSGLLRDSVQRSASLGVRYSCTVRLDDRVRCIRDGGKWKDCKGGSSVGDIVRDIEALYDQK